jgi:hypothetical protein
MDEVFAVVEHQEQGFARQRGVDALLQRFTGTLAGAHGSGDGVEDEVGLGHQGQVHEPGTVGVAVQRAGGAVEAEAGLADAGGAHQRDQPVSGQESSDIGHLALATDEAGVRPRQVVRTLFRKRPGFHRAIVPLLLPAG